MRKGRGDVLPFDSLFDRFESGRSRGDEGVHSVERFESGPFDDVQHGDSDDFLDVDSSARSGETLDDWTSTDDDCSSLSHVLGISCSFVMFAERNDVPSNARPGRS